MYIYVYICIYNIYYFIDYIYIQFYRLTILYNLFLKYITKNTFNAIFKTI